MLSHEGFAPPCMAGTEATRAWACANNTPDPRAEEVAWARGASHMHDSCLDGACSWLRGRMH